MEKKPLQPLGRGGKIALIIFGSIAALSACLWLVVSVLSGGSSGYVLLLMLSLLASAILWGAFLFRGKERSVPVPDGRVLAPIALVLAVVGVTLSLIGLYLNKGNPVFFIGIFSDLVGQILGIIAACKDGKGWTVVVGVLAALLPIIAALSFIGLLLVGAPIIDFM